MSYDLRGDTFNERFALALCIMYFIPTLSICLPLKRAGVSLGRNPPSLKGITLPKSHASIQDPSMPTDHGIAQRMQIPRPKAEYPNITLPAYSPDCKLELCISTLILFDTLITVQLLINT